MEIYREADKEERDNELVSVSSISDNESKRHQSPAAVGEPHKVRSVDLPREQTTTSKTETQAQRENTRDELPDWRTNSSSSEDEKYTADERKKETPEKEQKERLERENVPRNERSRPIRKIGGRERKYLDGWTSEDEGRRQGEMKRDESSEEKNTGSTEGDRKIRHVDDEHEKRKDSERNEKQERKISKSRSSRESSAEREKKPLQEKTSKDKTKVNEEKDKEHKKGKQQHGKKKEETMEERISRELAEWEERRRQEIYAVEQEKAKKKMKQEQDKEEKERRRKETLLQQLQEDLLEACEKQDVQLLDAAVRDVIAYDCVKPLQRNFDKAWALLTSLQRIGYLDDAKACLTQNCVTELHSYKFPHEVVKKTVRATGLLVGVDTRKQDWAACQKMCTNGRNGLYNKMRKFELSQLDAATAKNAMKLLEGVQRNDILSRCTNATIFYDWTVGHCELRLQAEGAAKQQAKDKNKQQTSSAGAASRDRAVDNDRRPTSSVSSQSRHSLSDRQQQQQQQQTEHH